MHKKYVVQTHFWRLAFFCDAGSNVLRTPTYYLKRPAGRLYTSCEAVQAICSELWSISTYNVQNGHRSFLPHALENAKKIIADNQLNHLSLSHQYLTNV